MTGDIKLSANFQANVAKPLDDKFTAANIAERDSKTFLYTGLECYVESEDKYYKWNGTGWVERPTGNSLIVSADGTPLITNPDEINFGNGLSASETGGVVTVEAERRDVYVWAGSGAPVNIKDSYVEWVGAITSADSQITFNITDDGTATGTPIFNNLAACGYSLATNRDTDLNNEAPWAHMRSFSGDNKTILVQVKKSNTGPVILLGSYSGNLNNTNNVTTFLRIIGQKYTP